MQCRPGCGACCIAPSISSPIPGLTGTKAAGIRCPQLDAQNRCLLFGHPDRPRVCSSFAASEEYCGKNREEAMHYLATLEAATV